MVKMPNFCSDFAMKMSKITIISSYWGVSLSLLSLDKKNAKMTSQKGQRETKVTKKMKNDKGDKKH